MGSPLSKGTVGSVDWLVKNTGWRFASGYRGERRGLIVGLIIANLLTPVSRPDPVSGAVPAIAMVVLGSIGIAVAKEQEGRHSRSEPGPSHAGCEGRGAVYVRSNEKGIYPSASLVPNSSIPARL